MNRRYAVTQLKNVPRRDLPAAVSTAAFLAALLILSAFSSACSTKRADMRSLAPADTLIYLETNDLAGALQPIIDSKPFIDAATQRPDLSALSGVQLAIAITGFETKEERLTDEHSVGRVQPRFVAVADTHAWNYQAVAFAEQKLGGFVERIYDSPPTLVKANKSGGSYFTWTAKDGRKSFALVIDSLIYFGNDESAIDKCLAVRRGEADSLAKAGKVRPSQPGTLASGYIGSDGVAQISSVIGLKFASEAGEEAEVKSAISSILPLLLRNSVTEISWTAEKTDQGIVDSYMVTMPPELARVLNETMAPSDDPDRSLLNFVPDGAASVTAYNLKDPQVAWRSVLLAARKQTDPTVGKAISEFSSIFFVPYGIGDPEIFLSSVNHFLITVKCDAEGEKPAVIATSRNISQTERSMLKDLLPVKEKRSEDGEVRMTNDNDLTALLKGNRIAIGDSDCVGRINAEDIFMNGGPSVRDDVYLKQLRSSSAPITSLGSDTTSAGQIAEVVATKRSDSVIRPSAYFTETRFTGTGMERKTTSDFGFVGWIIAQLSED